MTTHTPPASASQAFPRSDGVDRDGPLHGTRRPPAWFKLLALMFHALAAPGLRGKRAASEPEAADELDEVDWGYTPATESGRQAPGDWVFPSFFLCMAVVALPLIGTRWTTPESMASWHSFADSLVFALPLIVPLPFLFLGCLGVLAFQAASRTPAAFAFLGAAMLIGIAGVHALLGPL